MKNLKTQKKYPDVWFGFRVGIYAYFVKKNFYTINKNLTFYKSYGESKKYKFFSFNWFRRRLNSFDYLSDVTKKKNIFKYSLDYNFTKVITFLLNLLK